MVGSARICAVIPACDEERSIGRVIRELRAQVPEIDVLVVNDGSRDRTEAEAHANGAHVLSLPVNVGYGSALHAGLRWALEHDAAFVVTLDADGQHDPNEVSKILSPVLEGKVDLALGSRYLSHGARYRVPMLRRAGSWFFARIVSLLARQKITDPTTGFQAMNRRVLESYASMKNFPRRSPDADILLYANRLGYRITECAVIMHADEGTGSMHSTLRSAAYPLQMLISITAVLLRKR